MFLTSLFLKQRDFLLNLMRQIFCLSEMSEQQEFS